MLVPPIAFHESFSHVLWFGSPGCATRSNVQTSAPVRAFHARITGDVAGVISMSL